MTTEIEKDIGDMVEESIGDMLQFAAERSDSVLGYPSVLGDKARGDRLEGFAVVAEKTAKLLRTAADFLREDELKLRHWTVIEWHDGVVGSSPTGITCTDLLVPKAEVNETMARLKADPLTHSISFKGHTLFDRWPMKKAAAKTGE